MTAAADAFIKNYQCSPRKLNPQLNFCCASNSPWPSANPGVDLQRDRGLTRDEDQMWSLQLRADECGWQGGRKKFTISAHAVDILWQSKRISCQGQHVELPNVSIPHKRVKTVVEFLGMRQLQGTLNRRLAGWDKGEWGMTFRWKNDDVMFSLQDLGVMVFDLPLDSLGFSLICCKLPFWETHHRYRSEI